MEKETDLALQEIPDRIWERFHDSDYMAAFPELLDFEQVQFMMIGAHSDAQEELGIAV